MSIASESAALIDFVDAAIESLMSSSRFAARMTARLTMIVAIGDIDGQFGGHSLDAGRVDGTARCGLCSGRERYT
jgi:hypothetical protein